MKNRSSVAEGIALPVKYMVYVCLDTCFLLFLNFFAKAQSPSITSFSLSAVCQGEVVSIIGTNFINVTGVRLGNLNAASFAVNSATSITATVAAQATSGPVTVTTSGGATSSAQSLIIKPAPQPVLTDVGTQDAPFSNCDASSTYQLRVSNSSVVTGTGNVYRIDWGDNSSPFVQTDWPVGEQLVHLYTTQGYFPVTITITSASGCSKSANYQFYKGRNPVAFFSTTSSTTALCAPSSVEFQIGNWSNNSPGTIYVIDFGDGSPKITLQHPLSATNTTYLLTHQYTRSSCPSPDFKASLKVTNGCYTTTYTLDQIIIRQKPDADFSISAACAKTPVCFTNQTKNGYMGNSCSSSSNFIWDFGDGTTSTETDPPCHVYEAGTYTITLSASNAACGSGIVSKQIKIAPVSSPPVVATQVSYCQGAQAVPLTATGTGLLWYTSASGGTGSASAPTPVTTTSGTKAYYVSQTLPDNCESPRVQVNVVVNALPASPVVSSPVNLCLGQPAVSLTATGAGLLWYGSASGGTGSPVAPIPSTAATGSTTWYVSQTVNSCEGARAAITALVSTTPAAPVVTTPITYCQDQAASRLTATGASLLWYTAATGGTGSASAPTPVTATPGSLTYYVSQTTSCGESPRASIVVNISNALSASISYGRSDFCNSKEDPSAPNPPVSVLLTGAPGGVYGVTPATGLRVDAATGMIYPSDAVPGKYTIRYTIPPSGNCSGFATTDIVINAAPASPVPAIFKFCMNADVPALPVSGISTGNSVQWYDKDLNAIAHSPVVNTVIPGEILYYVRQSSNAGCPGPLAKMAVVVLPSPSAPAISVKNPLCVGDVLVMQANSTIEDNSMLEYAWSGPGIDFPANAARIGIASVKMRDAGVYSIKVRSLETGCSATRDTLIRVGDYPVVQFQQGAEVLTLPPGYRLTLTPLVINSSDPGVLPVKDYLWTSSRDLVFADPEHSSAVTTISGSACYKVLVTNIYGCSAGSEICVKSLCQNVQVFVPNAFAPTGNIPENRKLTVRASGITTIRSFKVFNRWGRVVFERNNFSPNSPEFAWDGMLQGRLADSGVYVYTVDAICENGVLYSFKGNVTLF